MLGLSWKRGKDFLAVEISSEIKKLTKQTILQKMTSLCNPLGIIPPTATIGKIICCDICDSKISWDNTLSNLIVKKGRNGRRKYQQK